MSPLPSSSRRRSIGSERAGWDPASVAAGVPVPWRYPGVAGSSASSRDAPAPPRPTAGTSAGGRRWTRGRAPRRRPTTRRARAACRPTARRHPIRDGHLQQVARDPTPEVEERGSRRSPGIATIDAPTPNASAMRSRTPRRRRHRPPAPRRGRLRPPHRRPPCPPSALDETATAPHNSCTSRVRSCVPSDQRTRTGDAGPPAYGDHSMRGLLGVLFTGVVAITAGVIGFQAGVASNIGAAGGAVVLGGGLFPGLGFLFFLFFIGFLLFAFGGMRRRAWGYGPMGGPGRGAGPAPGPEGDPRRQWIVEAHRRLHEEEAAAGASPAAAIPPAAPCPAPARRSDRTGSPHPQPPRAGILARRRSLRPESHAHDPRRRGRAADRRPRPRLPRARRLRRHHGGRRSRPPSRSPAPAGRTRSSWTSVCRAWTASTSSGRSAATRAFRSSSCRRAATRRTASRAWSWARTTTWSSPSARVSSSPASAPSCAGPRRRRSATSGSRPATSSSTSSAAG